MSKFLSAIKDSKTRIITAIFMIIVIFLVAFLDKKIVWWFFFGLMYLTSIHEMLNILKIESKKYHYVSASLLWIFSYNFFDPILLSIIFLILSVSILVYKKASTLNEVTIYIYPTISFLFLWNLSNEFGLKYLVWLVLGVAICDIGAYYSGKSFGKRKFSPTSPNKTVEGVIGGVVIATTISSIYAFNILDTPFVIIASFLISVSSVFGDLFESYLKRESGIKDSGNIFPGHGGVLDRLDGYLFAVIVEYFLLKVYI